MFKNIIGIGNDRYTLGAKTVGSVLLSRMKLAGS
jgi:PmbA protein